MTDAAPQPTTLSVTDILRRTFALLAFGSARAMIALALMTGAGVAVDTGALSEGASQILNLVLSIGSLVLQYWIVRAQLGELGYTLPDGARFPAFFVMGLVGMLAIILGLILLVVPGLVLLVRWSMATPIVIGSNTGAIASLGESWRVTRGNSWPVLGASLAIWAVALAVAFGGLALEPFGVGLVPAQSSPISA